MEEVAADWSLRMTRCKEVGWTKISGRLPFLMVLGCVSQPGLCAWVTMSTQTLKNMTDRQRARERAGCPLQSLLYCAFNLNTGAQKEYKAVSGRRVELIDRMFDYWVSFFLK